MKEIRKGHTVACVIGEKYIYGTVERIHYIEEEPLYTVVTYQKVYKNIKRQWIIHNYGVLNDD